MSSDQTNDSQQAYEKFRLLLADHAPLPWDIVGGFIVDANGNAILGSTMTNPESVERVLAAVICGVATCGGYRIKYTEEADSDEVIEGYPEDRPDLTRRF